MKSKFDDKRMRGSLLLAIATLFILIGYNNCGKMRANKLNLGATSAQSTSTTSTRTTTTRTTTSTTTTFVPLVLQWPRTYIQSGVDIITPGRQGMDWRWHSGFTDINKAMDWMRLIAYQFDGLDIHPVNIETPAGLQNARLIYEAIRRVSEERISQGHGPFIGNLMITRLPGFAFHRRPSNSGWTPPADNLFPLTDELPMSYRARSLKSDGSLHVRWPPPVLDGESIISFSGKNMDITNEEAVNLLLNNIRRIYRVSCPDNNCIGPMYGYLNPSEWTLTKAYLPFSKDADERDLAYTSPINGTKDPVVAHPELRDSPCTGENRPKWPRLSAGNPCDLFVDQDTRYSFFHAPLRGIPLYSVNAKNSFIAYLNSIGKGTLTNKLPADRSEFNQDGATLPSHIRFVGRSTATDREIWRHWEDWIYKTHHSFLRRVFQAVVDAQAGNPHFLGVTFFQYPIWFSMRQRSKTPVTFTYNTQAGYRQETLTVAQHPEYPQYDHPTSGIDLAMLLQDPNVKGFIYETTTPLPQFRFPTSMTLQEKENLARFSERHKVLVMARAKMAKELTKGAGKIFGAFQRYHYFPDAGNDDFMPPAQFEDAWNDVIPILRPDLIATLPMFYYYRATDIPTHLQYRVPMSHPALGRVHDIWRQLLQNYRSSY